MNLDIDAWLRGIGLSRYAENFHVDGIDGQRLSRLTNDDLRDMGVVSLGHRKKLLRAIAALATAPESPDPAPAAVYDAAERRQLTVMFVDLVGSTALSARLDPEDMHEVITTYRQCCARLTAANGGFVARYMGDGVLAYFGYPHAHEYDAERAVRAGLAIAEAAPKLKTAAQAPLRVRVGVATGIVVVGDLFGTGESHEPDIVGETPNLAARLQRIAAPDGVVIAEGARRLLGDLFELEELGTQELEGVARPTRVWAAVRESSQASRFDALHSGELSPLVGREQEIGLLLRCWREAKEGQGHVVLLSGEAGIGKSRLTAGFLERLTDEPYTRLRYFCSPQHTDSAFHPIIGHMTRRARLARGDDAKTKLDKLEALLAMSDASREDAALVAEMLSVPNDGRYPELDLAPLQRRQKTMEALMGRIEAISRRSPVLIIIEDAHWADPSSLEAFGRVLDHIGALRALMLVTFRPDLEAPWVGRPHVTALTLNRLAPDAASVLIGHIAVGRQALAENVRQDIVDRSDCVPLFVEEITKAVLEAESEGAAAPSAASVHSTAPAVPASLHASLMARLDRLGPAKGVAQVGAAIGRGFSHALLAHVASLPELELNSALDRLLRSGLLSRQGSRPNATYLFKHALVQDTAYGSLLREPRRTLHARIAEVLESQFADLTESEPELLARHLTEAGLIERASRQWGKAGLRSLARSALIEAAAQLSRALAQIAALPTTPDLRREQIRLQVGLAQALMHSKGYAAPETKQAFEQARILMEREEALGEPPEDPLALFWVLYGFWAVNYVAFNETVVRELAEQFLALARKQGGIVPIMIGHRLVGCTLLSRGDVAASRPHFDQAIALYEPTEHQEAAARFAPDLTLMSLAWRALVSWMLGYPEAAGADLDRALAIGRETGRAVDLMFALIGTQPTRIQSGNYAKARAQLDEGLRLADEKGASFWKAMGTMFEGCVFALTGEPAKAVSSIVSAIAPYRSTGATLYMPFYVSHLAQAYAALGQFDDARRCIGEALATLQTTGTDWLEADVHRISGEIALMSPERDVAEAQACFERALAIAHARQARSWELRAAISLAR
ncbi:MAG TPA: adenylate/guanylate cyclase domain-containing protein, partial [Roseiarcus sp.]|nr:adenylate/guanylate cyclase domain-containing protein [Roseiarcus sp.]